MSKTHYFSQGLGARVGSGRSIERGEGSGGTSGTEPGFFRGGWNFGNSARYTLFFI